MSCESLVKLYQYLNIYLLGNLDRRPYLALTFIGRTPVSCVTMTLPCNPERDGRSLQAVGLYGPLWLRPIVPLTHVSYVLFFGNGNKIRDRMVKIRSKSAVLSFSFIKSRYLTFTISLTPGICFR